MITKFKIYEYHLKNEYEVKYSVGDYVMTTLNLPKSRFNRDNYINDNVPAKIIGIEIDSGIDHYDYAWYNCVIIDGYSTMLDNNNIIRRMTDEEIKEYELRRDANKFNL